MYLCLRAGYYSALTFTWYHLMLQAKYPCVYWLKNGDLKMWMRDFFNLQDNNNSQLQSADKENWVAPPTLWTSVAALNSPYATGREHARPVVIFKKNKWPSFVCLFFGLFVCFLNRSLLLLCILLKVRKLGFYTVTCNLLLKYSLLEIGEDLLKGMQLKCNHSLGTAWHCFLVNHKICMAWVNRNFEKPKVLKSPFNITLGKQQNKKQKQTQLPARYI